MIQMEDKYLVKKQFGEDRDRLFGDEDLLKNSFQFCIRYSLLIEEYLFRISGQIPLPFALASAGSFSRRELSPHSDIDVMFIFKEIDGNEDSVVELVTAYWDCGIEVSHTVRSFSDINKFLTEDLHTYTQFFETRFILGNDKIYYEWNETLFTSVNDENKNELYKKYKDDIVYRYNKYGNSPKVLEPNIKFSAGGLRDLHAVEWIYSLQNKLLLTSQNEITQTEYFLSILRERKITNPKEIAKLLESYKLLLRTRNHLHLLKNQKNDRLEFASQEKISAQIVEGEKSWDEFMHRYFEAATIIHRFAKTILKKFDELLTVPTPDILSIELDEDFFQKGKRISIRKNRILNLSEILRCFYYRGAHEVIFDENLRSLIVESIHEIQESQDSENESSVFFREILRLNGNVGKTLHDMNELGVLGTFLPEFKELIGFFEPGVYHCYTADEHTLIAIQNLEELGGRTSRISKLYSSLREKDLLYLAVLLHDIAKPISVAGHEILGAEIASPIMERLGYDQSEIVLVQFLVRHHLTMEQVAFRRNLNDPATLDNFAAIFPSIYSLKLLYLLTYADLSAVSPAIWTEWKSDLVNELYRKTLTILEKGISGEELLHQDTTKFISATVSEADKTLRKHIESIDDFGYLQSFSQDEINEHISEIERGSEVSVFFKESGSFTNVTVMTKDTKSLLSRLCGALSINDLNIHDAQIYTRKDGIVIDSFNVSDFRTHKLVQSDRYDKITRDIRLAIENNLQINKEFSKVKSKWWRIENKLFSRKGKVKVEFEDHDKYTIIDIYSPDRLGLLYQVTQKMNELDLSVYFAKIATKADDVVDSFYTLTDNGKKVPENRFELIKFEIMNTIEEML